MLKSGKFAALAILGALAINPAFAEEKSAAMVNGISIPQTRIDLRVKAATAQGQADSPELRKAIREDMINLEVLVQEAARLGLDKNPDVVQQVELTRQQVLAGAFVQDYAKSHPVRLAGAPATQVAQAHEQDAYFFDHGGPPSAEADNGWVGNSTGVAV